MGFLKEATGGYSSNRLIFIIGSLWTMAITTFLVTSDVETTTVIAFFAAVEGVWVGLKLGQKQMEQKPKQNGS
jgi:hypothetical protein